MNQKITPEQALKSWDEQLAYSPHELDMREALREAISQRDCFKQQLESLQIKIDWLTTNNNKLRQERDLLLITDVCQHSSCSTISGRKRDYLYCNDCHTALSYDGE